MSAKTLGELVCIVGSVGSGKSALLRGLLNEMSHDATSVVFNGSLAYGACHQLAALATPHAFS